MANQRISLEAGRFIIVGVIVTIVGTINFFLLNLFFPYNVAYSIAFVIGLLLQFILQNKVVFKTETRISTAPAFSAVYISQFLVTILLLNLLIQRFSLNELLAFIIATGACVPITFVLNRLILVGRIR